MLVQEQNLAQTLENAIHSQIPISKALGVTVAQASLHEVAIHALFTKNLNHKSTVFGGSLHAVCTFAAWSVVYLNMQSLDEQCEIVITHSEVDYRKPVLGNFDAHATLDLESALWQRFQRSYLRKNKAKIQIHATIQQDNATAVAFSGTFAVIG